MRAAYTFLGVVLLLLLGTVFVATDTAKQKHSQHSTATTTRTNTAASMEYFSLTTTAFEVGGTIPTKYTCDGAGINPLVSITGVPADAQSLVLIMDDPDIPDSVQQSLGKDTFDHWVVFNIPPETEQVPEGEEPPGVLGAHDAGGTGYTGPCPPDGEHRYFFKLYALDTMLDLPAGASKAAVQEAMQGHVINEAELMGRYSR